MKFFNINFIRNKLALLILITVLPCLAIFFYSGIEQRRHLIEIAQSNVVLLTHSIAQAQRTVTQSTQQVLITLSQAPTIQAMDPNACTALLSSVLKKNSDFNNFVLVDLKGEVIASGKPFTGANLADRKHFKEAIENDEFAAGEYIVTRVGNANPSFGFAYPVPDKNGRPKGVLTATLKLESFSKFYDVSRLPEKSFISITDYKGIRIFYYPTQVNTNPIGQMIQAKSWDIATHGGEEGLFFGTGSDGQERMFAYVKIHLLSGDAPYLYVWAGIPKSHIVAPANAALSRNLLLLFLVTLISLYISWVIGNKTLISPIQRLVILTQKFAKGDLEASKDASVNDGELGMLANAFFEMAQSLTTSRKALEKSEQRFKLAQQSAGIGVWDWDMSTGRLAWSPELFRLFGLDPDKNEPTFSLWDQVLHPDDKVDAYRRMERAIEEDRILDNEYRILFPDKQVRWIKALGKTTSDQTKKPVRMAGICIDITERKLAEESLKETERIKTGLLEKLNAAQHVAGVGSWEWDLQTDHVWWSDETYHIFGVKPENFVPSFEANGKFIHPDDFENYVNSFDHAFQTGESLDLDIRLNAADGQMKHCNAKGEVVCDDSGKQVRFIGTIMDISNKVQSENEKNRLQAQLSNAMEMAHLGHWEYDIVNDLFTFNDHFYKIYRTTVGQVGGYTMPSAEYARLFVHPDDMALVGEEIRQAIEAKDPDFSRSVEHRMLYADGAVGFISVRFFILKDDQGRTVKTYGVNQDITERKKIEVEKEMLQTQLNQAQKMESVGHLAGGVAHDFNNMLSIILGYGNIILEKTKGDDPLHEYAQEIIDAGSRSASITRQLLAFARKQTIEPKVLDLNESLEGMLKMLRRLIGEDLELIWHPSPIWQIYMDPSQLDQILANLCVNARDAIKGVGSITIETGKTTIDESYCSGHPGFIPGEFVLLTVSDNGIGMDPATIAMIFEPFFTTKETGKGTGLGLATVYGIVKQNNGFINVYSELDHGTTFRVYLPRHAEPITSAEKKKDAVILHGRGETILVVEDEASILRLTSRILTNLGYTVFTANSPGEAIQFAKETDKTINLLITDVIMPEMNGRDLANVLLAMDPNIKCLFMSGYTSTVIAGKGVLEEGMRFMQKPFSAADLSRKVGEILKSDKGTVP
ncbi:PAS domain-containing protein [Desulfopila aestuarii]|uniref:histidine kinase n=1 Tax=Desulfopila aestuarii DSM 18488 TaxID=1121416 RepID=A0A1M7YI15_9BACT|nr:PAS domain-containing protein [Desulfopila aestuarii]SHO52274.1 PAS domain S-box-containing protein [Desulfopila aestuarii DSM 18488]